VVLLAGREHILAVSGNARHRRFRDWRWTRFGSRLWPRRWGRRGRPRLEHEVAGIELRRLDTVDDELLAIGEGQLRLRADLRHDRLHLGEIGNAVVDQVDLVLATNEIADRVAAVSG